MNKLKTTDNGGMPFQLDDLRWIDASVREAFKGLASFIGTNSILSGVTETVASNIREYNTGFVLIDGEVYIVTSTSTVNTDTNPFIYIEPVITYDPTGLETFQDSNQYDTYEIRKASVIAYATAQSGKILYSDFVRATQTIAKFVEGYLLRYTKRQDWAQGSANPGTAGDQLFRVNPSTGNSFAIDITLSNPNMKGMGSIGAGDAALPFPAGTLIALEFTGTGQVVIEHSPGYTGGICDFNTNGISYLFKAGEVALFKAKAGGQLVLMNGHRTADWWHVVGAPNEPAFQNTFLQQPGSTGVPEPTVAFTKEGDWVTIKGCVIHANYNTSNLTAFTLPAGYRPSHLRAFSCMDEISADVFEVVIRPDGKVDLLRAASNGNNLRVFLDPITFRL